MNIDLMTGHDSIAGSDDVMLVTGANGFIGRRVVATLLRYGFTNIRCLVRPSSNAGPLEEVVSTHPSAKVEVVQGNLLSAEDCVRVSRGAVVVFHLAAGIDKSFAGSFMNSVVTTRNLLDSLLVVGALKRFVNVSSFAVYDNSKGRRGSLFDEQREIDHKPELRGEAYCYGKVKQDELLLEYGRRYHIPYVIMRPGAVIGPGKRGITGRVGIDTFGIYLHLGGSNRIPFTYVDNCAEAIVLAGVTSGVEGEVFNIVDDDLPTSRRFLRSYKKNVRSFRSLYLPYRVAYFLSFLWERYAERSEGQLPRAFNRRRCVTEWKGNKYTNEKLKRMLGWRPRVPMDEALRMYFEYQKRSEAQG